MNRANLLKLAEALDTEIQQEQFGMGDFSSGDRYSTDPKTICGAVACALGWAPLYVEPPVDADCDENGWFRYHRYCRRVFHLNNAEWEWCFGSDWDEIDNTSAGAAARIRYMLGRGAPETYDDRRPEIYAEFLKR